MRNLCGSGSYASISLSAFSQGDFQLEPLIRANAIIVDENDVGTYIGKAPNLKAVITNDVIQINRKFKSVIAYQFFGFMVQCLNEFPRIKDTSDSLYRRQLFIKFDKCFTGAERKYIKNEYLSNPAVQEYVLFKVLNMTYYELSEPESCRMALEEYKEYNDPLQTFMNDILGESGELLAELAGTGTWLEGQRFRSGAPESDVQTWVRSLNLPAASPSAPAVPSPQRLFSKPWWSISPCRKPRIPAT